MHDFTITEAGNITIMHCRRCGSSYQLKFFGGINLTPSYATWVEMPFVDTEGKPIETPRSCGEEVSANAATA